MKIYEQGRGAFEMLIYSVPLQKGTGSYVEFDSSRRTVFPFIYACSQFVLSIPYHQVAV